MSEPPAATNLIGNCDLCGKARDDLRLEMVINGVPQYIGGCCRKRKEKLT